MKTVFNNAEIPHLWAHRTQEHGRNSNGSLFFEGDTIYSYGKHFPIARHVQNAEGANAVLITTKGYSVTTSRHCSIVERSVNRFPRVFHVPLENTRRPVDPADYVGYFDGEIKARTLTAARSRQNKTFTLEAVNRLVNEANAYCEFFGLPNRWETVPEDQLKAALDAYKEHEERKRQDEERKHREYINRTRDTVERWLAGERVEFPYGLQRTYLRVEGDEVVSSRGARFPARHALKGLKLVRAVVATGETWQRNGKTCHLGHYQIDRIDSNGTVYAGCHVVELAEIERIAPALEAAMATETEAA